MAVRAQTIQIFLPHGDPRGLRIAEITSRTIKACQVPRSELGALLARPEALQPTCYFLFGESVDGGMAYIGQSEDVAQRLASHDDKKDFWSQFVMVVSGTNAFTQTHIRYLEWLAIDRAKKAQRYDLDNGNAGSQPYAPEAIEADILDAFDTISILLASLGFPLFEPILQAHDSAVGAATESRPVFHCSSSEVRATGEWAPEGFVIHAGSTVRGDVVTSISGNASFMKRRQRLIDDGKLRFGDDRRYVVVNNLALSSPSFASSLVLGRPSNGWDAWVTDDGRNLDAVYRQTSVGLGPEQS